MTPIPSTRQLPDDDWVELGYVAKPHGIQGEVHVKLHNPQSTILFEVDEVLARWNGNPARDRCLAIRAVRPAADGVVLIAFEGVDSRAEAESVRGAGLCVPRGVLPPEEDGEFYVHDIVGAEVVLQNGTVLGKVLDVISYPTVDVVVVRGPVRYEIPMIEDFVVRLDTVNKVVVVDGVDDFKVG